MNIDLKEISFKGSYPSVEQCPRGELPEFAFIGRSNVGKSSLINMLAQRKKLAKTSQTPGKTRLINLFEVDHRWQLADLPGYGYAKISKTERHRFPDMIANYLLNRENLTCAFQLIDANIPLQENDLELINWMGHHLIPFIIVYTKIDKSTRNKRKTIIHNIEELLKKSWENLPLRISTSAEKNIGRNELLTFIGQSV